MDLEEAVGVALVIEVVAVEIEGVVAEVEGLTGVAEVSYHVGLLGGGLSGGGGDRGRGGRGGGFDRGGRGKLLFIMEGVVLATGCVVEIEGMVAEVKTECMEAEVRS